MGYNLKLLRVHISTKSIIPITTNIDKNLLDYIEKFSSKKL